MNANKKVKRLHLTAWILFAFSFLLAFVIGYADYYISLINIATSFRYFVNVICILMGITGVLLLFQYYHKYRIENYHIWILILFILHCTFTFNRRGASDAFYSVTNMPLGEASEFECYVSLISIIVAIIYCFVRKRVLGRICVILWQGTNLARILSLLYFYMQNGIYPTTVLLTPVILYGAMIMLLILQHKATAAISAVAIVIHILYKICQLLSVLTYEIVPGFTALHFMTMLGYAYTLSTVLDIALIIAIWYREGGRLLFKRKIPYEQIEAELLELKTRFDRGEISVRKYSRLKEKVLRKIDLR